MCSQGTFWCEQTRPDQTRPQQQNSSQLTSNVATWCLVTYMWHCDSCLRLSIVVASLPLKCIFIFRRKFTPSASEQFIVISSQNLHSEQRNVWKSWGRREGLQSAYRSRSASLGSQPEQSAAHPRGSSTQPHGSNCRSTATNISIRPSQPFRVSRVLRLCSPTHTAVSRWASCVQQLQAEAHLLSHLQGTTRWEH